MKYLPLLAVALVLVVLIRITLRNRRRAFEQQTELRAKIGFGSEVMTTSGLYGTVVQLNGDDSVQLAIAPGVQVKWALAALRDISSLPAAYQPGGEPPDNDAANPTSP